MPRPPYVQQRRRRYYAVLEIPAALRPRFEGKPRFVKSLETESLTVAKVKVHQVIAGWQADLEQARAGLAGGASGSGDDAARYRQALRNARTAEQRSAILERIDDAADAIGYANVDHMGQLPSSSPEAGAFYAEATGQRVATLEHLDAWLSRSHGTAKTKDMHSSDVKRFAVRFPMLRDVQRPEVKRWVTSLSHEQALAPKTIQRVLSGIRGYWKYLQHESVVSETDEPFAKLDVARQSKTRGATGVRQPFEPADVPRLVQGALERDDAELADLIRLAMWSGCRIEELCALKLADVKGDSFRVREAKSDAGIRVVPIHAELQPVMARLIGQRTEGYVLAKLSFNKYGDRSNAVGKRFGRLRTAMKFGPELVFHSIRKTVVTILENAGVSENVVADIVGHEKPRITYGLYSGGATLEVKRAALAKLSYPD